MLLLTTPISVTRWHAHSTFQRADGLFGALVVHPPAGASTSKEALQPSSADYEDDIVLMVGDWYHLPAQEVQNIYDSYTQWGMEPAPDSLLINGLGMFPCDRSPRGRKVDCMRMMKPELVPRASRSRLRIINVGSVTTRYPTRTGSRSLTC